MMHCAVCGLRLYFCQPDLFVCPTGHFALRVTFNQADHTTANTQLSTTGDRNAVGWGELPARTPVHPWYHDAFRDVEMLEP